MALLDTDRMTVVRDAARFRSAEAPGRHGRGIPFHGEVIDVPFMSTLELRAILGSDTPASAARSYPRHATVSTLRKVA